MVDSDQERLERGWQRLAEAIGEKRGKPVNPKERFLAQRKDQEADRILRESGLEPKLDEFDRQAYWFEFGRRFGIGQEEIRRGIEENEDDYVEGVSRLFREIKRTFSPSEHHRYWQSWQETLGRIFTPAEAEAKTAGVKDRLRRGLGEGTGVGIKPGEAKTFGQAEEKGLLASLASLVLNFDPEPLLGQIELGDLTEAEQKTTDAFLKGYLRDFSLPQLTARVRQCFQNTDNSGSFSDEEE